MSIIDTFVISLLFDSKGAEESAKKIETVVDNLIKSIMKRFGVVSTFNFFKNAIEQTAELTTKLDNLSYVTNVGTQSLSAWGEAVKRNGGTADGFFTSISNLTNKLIEVQTSFGSPGQLVFARLGLNLQKANGEMKTSTELLVEIGDKFKNLPKVWQLSLGKQLGLDQSTLRLISQGSKEALALVEKMQRLSGVSDKNTEQNIKYRNSIYDVLLIWQNIKLTIANALLPILTKFNEMLVAGFRFFQEHGTAARILLFAIGTILGGVVLNAIVAVADVIIAKLIPALVEIAIANPELYVLAAAILAVLLTLQDFYVYLNGGKSAFENYYKWISKTAGAVWELGKALFHLPLNIIHKIGSFFSDNDRRDDSVLNVENPEAANRRKIVEDIVNVAKNLGFDPRVALTIADIESGLNPNAKSPINPKTGKPYSTASGLFQLIDETALEQGVDLKNKNDPIFNAVGGIGYLKKVASSLKDFLGREPTGNEIYQGERFGIQGFKKLRRANPNSMAAAILGPAALRANPDIGNLTTSQLINNANKSYASHAVSIGKVDIQINSPNGNPLHIANAVQNKLQQSYSKTVTNFDNGVKQ